MFNLDVFLFNLINGFAGKNVFVDYVAIFFAEYLVYFFVIYIIYLFFKKRTRPISLYSLYSVILSLLLNYFVSLLYFRPRPFVSGLGHSIIEHSADASFPSDHTAFMLSIAFMLLYFKKTRKEGYILSILGIFGGLARVFCGIHYPLDILGSLIVAGISSFLVFLLRNKTEKINKFINNLAWWDGD